MTPGGPLGGALAALKIHLLGRFEVVRGDTPVPPSAWRRRRPADVLKLLALAPGHRLPRDHVIDTLWPDKDPQSGANNLHRALYDLRQVLGGRWVEVEHGQVSLRREAWVDVDAFEAAVASGRLEALPAAIGLYKGDLSPEDPDAPWLAPRRAALRQAFAGAALPLASGLVDRGDGPAAVSLLRRLLEVRPEGEEAHRLLMRLLAQTGRRADSLRQYDACELALRAAGLGPPGPETRALREAVQRGEVGPGPSRTPADGQRRAARRLLGVADPPPLRGRTPALLLAESLVERGSGALVLLGEPGVGTTRLAVEGARVAQEHGATVLAGVAGEWGPAPYSVMASALRDWQEASGAGGPDPFASLPRGPLEGQKLRLTASVERALQAAGGGGPLYLVVEDVHLADESSLNLLHHLARSARALKLMMVCTCREDEVRAGSPVQTFLAHLDCERLATGVRLGRLGLEATREQLADLLRSPPTDALVRQVYRATDGNPLYTAEVARALEATGHLSLPESPAAAIRARVAWLGPRAEALLAAAAAAGQRFEFEVVRPVSGLTAHEVLNALEACLEARLLEEHGGGYHFHHALVREAVYEALPPRRRLELHRAIADAVEARAVAAGEAEEASEALAFHRRAGEQWGAAFRHLAASGHRAAARGGLAEASAFYQQALELADLAQAGGAERLDLLETLGRLQLTLAETEAATGAFRAAAELEGPDGWRPDPEQRARARRQEALGLVAAGRAVEAEPILESALAVADGGSSGEAAEILWARSALAWHRGDPSSAAALADLGTREAARIGDPEMGARCREAAALARGTREADGAGRTDEAAEPFDLHLALWEGALAAGRPLAEVEAALGIFGDRASRRGAPRPLAVARAVEGALALEAGRLDAAEAALRGAVGLAREAEFALGEAFALERLGVALTARGRIDEGLDALGVGMLVAERAVLRRHALTRVHVALTRNRLAAGAVYAAEDFARESSETAARQGECAVCGALLRPELVRVALARGRLDEAERATADLETFSSSKGWAAPAAMARMARGRVLGARGATAEAVAALEEARQGFLGLGYAYQAARVLQVQARVLAAGGVAWAEEARRLAAQAAEALSAVGAVPADA
ncbi:MAG TPA: BTAD domain-containing putative transcriptional regulator [Anaeromyxobacteraceae bacterium]|nr:BTAD domain-containing putative transcriptional regulator [Anaeromyxobacteraceae bacterium]